MFKYLLILLSISASANQEVIKESKARAEFLKNRTPNLFVVNLPAGDVPSINIDWFNNGAVRRNSNDWLSQGYEGIVFKGQGISKTHIRGTSWDGITVAVGRHNGIVRFENLTIHSGYDRATTFGQQNTAKDYFPEFQIELVRVKGVVDKPFYFFERNGKFKINQSGTGYVVGEVLTAVGGEGTPAKFKVETLGPGGSVASLSVVTRGSYTKSPYFSGVPTLASASGTGCKLDLGNRPKWLWFGYNADLYMKNVISDAVQAVEHSSYMHGFAKYGVVFVDSVFIGSGAENFKVRSDSTETRWAGDKQIIYISNVLFRNWFQCHSWRGGGGLVVQGSGSHVFVEKTRFHGGGDLNCGPNYPGVASNRRSLAIGISSEGVSYDQQTGIVGAGYGNGHVILDQVAAYGYSDFDHGNNLVRIARNGGSQKSARSVLISNSSLWGKKMIVTVSNIDVGTGVLTTSNTPELKAFAESIGMNTLYEAFIPTYPVKKVSDGFAW